MNGSESELWDSYGDGMDDDDALLLEVINLSLINPAIFFSCFLFFFRPVS